MVEKIRIVGESDDGVPTIGDVERQVEVRRLFRAETRLRYRLAKMQALPTNVREHVEHDLEERRPGHVTRRFQLFDQPFERHVLMGVGTQRRFAHTRQQFPKRRIAREVRAQYQVVEEQPDQPLRPCVVTPGNRASHYHVGLPGPPREQQLERGEQRHERSHVLFATQLPHRLHESRLRYHLLGSSRMRLHRRPRPIGRHGQRGRVREPLHPVGNLSIHRRAREMLPLPARIVGILERQRTQWRVLAATERIVDLRELAQENVERRTVGDDVVHAHRQYVLGLAQAKQPRAQLHIPFEVKGSPYHFPHLLIKCSFPRGTGHRCEVMNRKVVAAEVANLLARLAITCDYDGAQRRMPLHDVCEARRERRGIEPAVQPEHDR